MWKPWALFTGANGAGYQVPEKPQPALSQAAAGHRAPLRSLNFSPCYAKGAQAALRRNLIWLLVSVLMTF